MQAALPENSDNKFQFDVKHDAVSMNFSLSKIKQITYLAEISSISWNVRLSAKYGTLK